MADGLEEQLQRLVGGLADREVRQGRNFPTPDNPANEFHPREVAVFMLPSILCIAQDLSRRLGVGSLGYRFEMTDDMMTPITAIPEKPAGFSQIAPFVTEVFDKNVMACRHDLTALHVTAIKLLNPEFSYDAPVGAVAPVAAAVPAPAPGSP